MWGSISTESLIAGVAMRVEAVPMRLTQQDKSLALLVGPKPLFAANLFFPAADAFLETILPRLFFTRLALVRSFFVFMAFADIFFETTLTRLLFTRLAFVKLLFFFCLLLLSLLLLLVLLFCSYWLTYIVVEMKKLKKSKR